MASEQYLSIPSRGTGLAPISSATAWAYGAWVQASASLDAGVYITYLQFQVINTPALDTTVEQLFEIGIGASSAEVTKIQIPYSIRMDTSAGYFYSRAYTIYLPDPCFIPPATRVSVRVTDSLASAITYHGVKIFYREVLAPVVALNSPANNLTTIDTTPALDFTGTSSYGSTLEYNIQINNSSTFDGDAFVALGQSQLAWYGVAIDPSNQNVYAVAYAGNIYKQTGGSGDFVSLAQTVRGWAGVGIDSANHNVYATVNSGDIYMQTNSTGNFIALGQTSRVWIGITVDSSNHNVYAVANGGGIYMQTNGTGNFVSLGEPALGWAHIAADSSNHNVYASVSGGGIYMQTNGTGSFVSLNQATRAWSGLAVDSSNHNVYASVNSGDTYKRTAGVGDFISMNQIIVGWSGIAVDSTNHNVYATAYLGDIYMQTNPVMVIDKLSATDTGFINITDGGDTHPFNNDNQIEYTAQSAIPGSAYYWRVKAKDPLSTCYGDWSATGNFNVSGAKTRGVSSWDYKPFKVWNGTSWVHKPIKVWNGTSWVVK